MSRIVPTGLLSTLDPTLIKPGAVAASANAIFEHGLIEARSGIAQLYKHTNVNSGSAFSSTDVFKGWGLGKYDDFDVLAAVIQPSGAGDAFLYVYNITSGVEYHFNDPRWTGLSTTDWRFVQYGPYLYAINSTNTDTGRFWRLKISGVASDGVITAADWNRTPVLYADLDPSDSTVILERPNPAYTGDYQWNVSGWAGAIGNGGFGIPDGSFYPVTTALTGTDLVLTNTGNTGSPTKFVGWFLWNFTTKIDLKANRLLYFEVEANCEFDDVRPNEEIYLDIISRPVTHAWVTDDASASESTIPASGVWKECRVKVAILDTSPVRAGAPIRIGITVDFDHLQYGNTGTDWITNIEKFAIGIPAVAGNNYTMTLSSPLVGGNFMSKPRYWKYMDGEGGDIIFDTITYYGAQLKDAEYATISYNTGTESSATFDRISGVSLVGLPQVPGLVALGSKVQITIPAFVAPYTGIRVFRRRWSDSGQWYCIYEGAGGTTITDSRVDATSDILAWDNSVFTSCPASNAPLRASDYDWGSQTAAFTGQCIASWKGHLVIGSGAEVYFSYQGDPTRFLRPLRDMTNFENLVTDDPTIGRTMYMDNTISDKVLALVAQDALYAVGYKGIYACIGDSAASATPFRKLPGAYGAISAEAVAGYQDGVIVGNATGLYYVRLSRLGQSVEQTTAIVEELTKDNRPFWELLIAKGTPNPLVVSVLDDVITACRGRFCMRRNKSGQWEYHEYSSTALTSGSTSPSNVWGTPISMGTLPAAGLAVTRGAAKSTYTGFDFAIPTLSGSLLPGWSGMIFDSSIGSLGISRSGIVFRLEKATTNIKYKTDAGYAIPWVVAFGDFGGEARFRGTGVQLVIENQDSGNAAGAVRYLVEEFDGVSGSRVFGFDRAQTDTYLNKPAFGTRGATYATSILCSGNAAQKVIHFSMTGTDAGSAKGN